MQQGEKTLFWSHYHQRLSRKYIKKNNTELTNQKECVSGLREYTYEETVTCVEETVANEELG